MTFLLGIVAGIIMDELARWIFRAMLAEMQLADRRDEER